MIHVEGFEKAYGENIILEAIDLQVARGEALVIIGPSGCGKSTLLRHLAGLENQSTGPVRGRIDIGEATDLLAWTEHKFVRKSIRGNRVGMLLQEGALFDFCNIEENLTWPLKANRQMGEDEIKNRIETMLEQVEMHQIPSILQKEVRELSGGQRRRIALARSLLLEPEVMLYDEPTSGLDPPIARDVARLIRKLSESRGLTSVTATHDMASARIIADRVCFLQKGRIRFTGKIDECDRHPEIRSFILGENLHATQ